MSAFPLPPREAVILAEFYRLLDARDVTDEAAVAPAYPMIEAEPAPAAPESLFHLPVRRAA